MVTTPIPKVLKPIGFKSHYIQALEGIVRAGLKDAIIQHGPITKNNMTSAVKRIVGHLKGYKYQRDSNYKDQKSKVYALQHFE